MAGPEGSMGRARFVEKHGLWTDEQHAAAETALATIEAEGLEVVRLSFADQHGILRGKSVVAHAFADAMAGGCSIVSTLLAKDTSHKSVFPVFAPDGGFGLEEMGGAGDIVMVPDPRTFRVLPWAEATGWVLCDIYFSNGKPVPFSSRRVLQEALAKLDERGLAYVSGLEIEFHLFYLEDARLEPEHSGQPAAPPDVSLVAHGFQHLTEQRLDQHDTILSILRRDLVALGVPLRTIEVEYGPTQVEITFDPGEGLETADNAVLFRNAVKQICRRHGFHATFMCRPAMPNLFSSGWHLHQSLVDRESGENVLMPAKDADLLSPLGRQFVAGLLDHARDGAVFSTPTLNGYKRFQPYSLAPDRATWGRDNRGVMLRVLGGAGDPSTRVENRIGEPAANPYLYMASQIHAGLDGVERGLEPATPADAPYETDAPPLPASLIEGVAALRDSRFFRAALGDAVIDYLVTIKEAEIARFLSTVTDWEHREYFDIF